MFDGVMLFMFEGAMLLPRDAEPDSLELELLESELLVVALCCRGLGLGRPYAAVVCSCKRFETSIRTDDISSRAVVCGELVMAVPNTRV